MAIKYSTKVIEHFTSPQNVGDLLEANATATEGSPACGDMVTFSLIINPDSRVVEDVRFRSFGCASNIATASMATLLAKGKTIEEVKRLTHASLTESLGGLPAVKMHCSVLAVDGLRAAIHAWEVEQGLVEETHQALDATGVHSALHGLLNPRNGEGLVESGMLGRLEIEEKEGRIFLEVKIVEADERFAENLESEIREKLETLPGVLKIIIQFKMRSSGE
jgi:NifU-like protein involved in Fe-S cluster formation